MINTNASCAKSLLRSLSIVCSHMKTKRTWRHNYANAQSLGQTSLARSSTVPSLPKLLFGSERFWVISSQLGRPNRGSHFEVELALLRGSVTIFSDFWRFFLREQKMAQVSRTSDYDRSVNRVNNFTAQAESSKIFFSPEQLSFPVALPCCRHYFSPHKMAAKSHRLSSHCRYRQDLDFSLVFTDFFTTLYQKVEGSFVNIP